MTASDDDNPTLKPTPKPTRGTRRKQRTRNALMKAGFELFAARGMDAVAINEITEAADVGFGSFYNHFESKQALLDALAAQALTRISLSLQEMATALDDPAEALAASMRYVIGLAEQDHLWGRFLLRTALDPELMIVAMGQFMQRDLQRGHDEGRFQWTDQTMAYMSAGMLVMGALMIVDGEHTGTNEAFRAIGMDTENVSQRTAVAVLENLGLSAEEAREVASRPLPEVALPDPLAFD